jgi:hypothetical protein
LLFDLRPALWRSQRHTTGGAGAAFDPPFSQLVRDSPEQVSVPPRPSIVS